MQTLLNFPAPVDGRADGERRRDAAHLLLSIHRERLIRDAQRAYLRHLIDIGPATSDVIHQAITIPDGVRPTAIGAAVRMLAVAHLIVQTGQRQRTGRAVAHARDLPLWRIADIPAAEAWLIAHPAMPEPADGSAVSA